MEFKSYTIDKFTTDLAGDLSSPGGGSTAALVAALAASLNSMVYSFTVDKKSFEKLNQDEKDEMRKLSNESLELIKESLNYMEEDRKSFTNLMDCFKLPKNTEEETIKRTESIYINTKASMEVPFNLAEKAIGFYDNIDFSIKHGNTNLTSDAVVAAILLHSAIESAVINVMVNFNAIKNKEEHIIIKEKCNEILEKSLERKNKIVKNFTTW